MDLTVGVGTSALATAAICAVGIVCMLSGTSRLHGVGRGTPDVVQMDRGVLSWQGLRRCLGGRVTRLARQSQLLQGYLSLSLITP